MYIERLQSKRKNNWLDSCSKEWCSQDTLLMQICRTQGKISSSTLFLHFFLVDHLLGDNNCCCTRKAMDFDGTYLLYPCLAGWSSYIGWEKRKAWRNGLLKKPIEHLRYESPRNLEYLDTSAVIQCGRFICIFVIIFVSTFKRRGNYKVSFHGVNAKDLWCYLRQHWNDQYKCVRGVGILWD